MSGPGSTARRRPATPAPVRAAASFRPRTALLQAPQLAPRAREGVVLCTPPRVPSRHASPASVELPLPRPPTRHRPRQVRAPSASTPSTLAFRRPRPRAGRAGRGRVPAPDASVCGGGRSAAHPRRAASPRCRGGPSPRARADRGTPPSILGSAPTRDPREGTPAPAASGRGLPPPQAERAGRGLGPPAAASLKRGPPGRSARRAARRGSPSNTAPPASSRVKRRDPARPGFVRSVRSRSASH